MNKDQGPLRNARLIRGLHYFEAVARQKSVKLAAEELGVSQSAVSHQLRDLTDALGEQLLTRAGRGIALTETGRRLAEQLATTFSGLQSSLDDIIGMSRPALRLAVCSSFGPGWLIPRLPGFYAAHGDDRPAAPPLCPGPGADGGGGRCLRHRAGAEARLRRRPRAGRDAGGRRRAAAAAGRRDACR